MPIALPFIMLAAAGGKRVRLMQAARLALGLPAAVVIEWQAWMNQPDALAAALAQPCVFKIETPGEDTAVHYRLLQKGCALLGLAPPPCPEHGELSVSGAWFAGLSWAMRQLSAQLAALPQVQVMNAPRDVLSMTDKLACQQHLDACQVAIPQLLGPIENYAHLLALLDHHRLDQVFVKARYGSSAAGVIAYRRNRRGGEQATTSAQLIDDSAGARLYNVKRVRSYHAGAEIAQLVDLLARQQAYAEAWIPKPRAGNGHFDVRVVTLAGQPAHRVARVGARMMTNLHLDNQRADVDALLNPAGAAALDATARQAAAAFPHSHVIGLDIVVRNGAARVLEANAFGDLLPGLLWSGHDTYAGQLRTLPHQ